MTENLAIQCKGISKIYGSLRVIDNLDLVIKYESIFGLLGPNGAGKTSLIKILTGLTKPTKGKAYVAGHDADTQSLKVRENIGWISSEVILDESLTVMENIHIQARLHNIGKGWKEKATNLLEYLELKDVDQKRVGKLSTGMKKKLEIIMALLHDPKILFMDEPTIGLDVSTRKLLWRLIKNINSKYGVTIFLTTHYIEEADALCDNIAIINNGKIIAKGSPTQLKSLSMGDIIEIAFFNTFEFDHLLKIEGILEISQIGLPKDAESIKPDIDKSMKLRFRVNSAETILSELISKITVNNSNNIESIKIEKPNLESIFLQLTGKRFEEIETVR
jgi:ABC-2 type transport system ATP-binding protein